jgi:hypothetical protein
MNQREFEEKLTNALSDVKCKERRTKTNPDAFTKYDLLELAKNLGLKNLSGLSKLQLCKLIRLKLIKNAKNNNNIMEKPVHQLSNSDLIYRLARTYSEKPNFRWSNDATNPLHELENWKIRLVLDIYDGTLTQMQKEYVQRNGYLQQLNNVIERHGDYVQEKSFNNNQPIKNNVGLKNNKIVLLTGEDTIVRSFVCPISLSIPDPSDMVYISKDVSKGIISTIYDFNDLKQSLIIRAVSPATRRKINSWLDVKKLNLKNNLVVKGIASAVKEVETMKNIEKLLQIFPSKILIRLKNYLTKIKIYNNKITTTNVNACHSKTNNKLLNVRLGCMNWVDFLLDYINSLPKNTQQEAMKQFDQMNPVCIEAMCKSIETFIQNHSNNKRFNTNSHSSKDANISKAVSFVAESICKRTSMNELYNLFGDFFTQVFSLVNNKKSSNGNIDAYDVKIFLLKYAESITCDKLNNFIISIPLLIVNPRKIKMPMKEFKAKTGEYAEKVGREYHVTAIIVSN